MREKLIEFVESARESGITIDELITEVKRQYVMASLHATHGNQVRAARNIGVHRNTLSRMIDELNIDVRSIRQAWLQKKPVASTGGKLEQVKRFAR